MPRRPSGPAGSRSTAPGGRGAACRASWPAARASGGLRTWRAGDAEARPGPARVGGGVGAERLLPDGRLVLAANLAPSDIVSVLDPACDAAADCRERFVGLGPQSSARLIEVVKLG